MALSKEIVRFHHITKGFHGGLLITLDWPSYSCVTARCQSACPCQSESDFNRINSTGHWLSKLGRLNVSYYQSYFLLRIPLTVWYKTKFGSQNLATKFGNHLCMCCKTCLATVLIRSIFAWEKLHERFSASAVCQRKIEQINTVARHVLL